MLVGIVALVVDPRIQPLLGDVWLVVAYLKEGRTNLVVVRLVPVKACEEVGYFTLVVRW